MTECLSSGPDCCTCLLGATGAPHLPGHTCCPPVQPPAPAPDNAQRPPGPELGSFFSSPLSSHYPPMCYKAPIEPQPPHDSGTQVQEWGNNLAKQVTACALRILLAPTPRAASLSWALLLAALPDLTLVCQFFGAKGCCLADNWLGKPRRRQVGWGGVGCSGREEGSSSCCRK